MLLTAAPELGLNARQVASKRYSNKDQQGQALEVWDAIVNRVVTHVSVAEQDANERKAFYRDMIEIMCERSFLPNTPCLVALYSTFLTRSPASWTTPRLPP